MQARHLECARASSSARLAGRNFAGRRLACLSAVLIAALPMLLAASPAAAQDDLVRFDALERMELLESRLGDLEYAPGESVVYEEPERFHLASFFGRPDPEIAIAYSQSYHTLDKPDDDKKDEKGDEKKEEDEEEEKKWYDKLGIRGYAQFRINETTWLEDGSAPPQYVGDRSIGDNQRFLIRRARVIIFGDVHEHLYVYLQPDFAVTPPGSTDQTNFAQIRDWYGDVYVDTTKIFRFRVGQSKIPYGWENLQSSSNRIVLDRADALNSAVRNERDLGVFFYYTPTWAQDFFKDVMDQGLKGSGNYGVFGIGCYNGQGGSLLEQNDKLHVASRLTLPMTLANGQYLEAGIQGYTGDYVVLGSTINPVGTFTPLQPAGTLTSTLRPDWLDERVAGSFIWYPQPIGFQTEWTVGRGPALNAAQTALEERSLHGGYAMLNYRIENCCGTWFPFVRYSYYQGGYKSERNAPYSFIDEWETGAEWQINPSSELTMSYLFTDRTNTTANSAVGSSSYGQFDGHVLRCQFQINY